MPWSWPQLEEPTERGSVDDLLVRHFCQWTTRAPTESDVGRLRVALTSMDDVTSAPTTSSTATRRAEAATTSSNDAAPQILARLGGNLTESDLADAAPMDQRAAAWVERWSFILSWLSSGVLTCSGRTPPLRSACLLNEAFTTVRRSSLSPLRGASMQSTTPLVRAWSQGSAIVVEDDEDEPSQQQGPDGILVMLLFHGSPVVRDAAREALMSQLPHLAQSPYSTTLGGAASSVSHAGYAAAHHVCVLWEWAVQLLAILRHLQVANLGPVAPSVPLTLSSTTHTDAPPELVGLAAGLVSLLVLLQALQERITTATSRLQSHGASMATAMANVRPAVLLKLGGILVVSLFLRAVEQASAVHVEDGSPTSNGRSGAASPTVAEASTTTSSDDVLTQLMDCVNHELRQLAPATSSLVRRSSIGSLVHALLHLVEALPVSAVEERWRGRRLELLWRMGAVLESPAPTLLMPTATVGAPAQPMLAPFQSASWMAKTVVQNLRTHLRLEAAVAEAKTVNQSLADSTPAPCDAVPNCPVLITAAYGLVALFSSLVRGVPGLFATTFFHALMQSVEVDLAAVAIGATLSARSPYGPQLHRLLLSVDIHVRFRSTTPPEASLPCLERGWAHYSEVLRRAVRPRHALPPHLLTLLVEVLTVLLEEPGLCLRLLLPPSTSGIVMTPPQSVLLARVDATLAQLTTTLAELRAAITGVLESGTGHAASSASGAALSRLLSNGSPIPRVVHVLQMSRRPEVLDLAKQLQSVFLEAMSVAVHRSFATDAAAFVWESVILAQPTLSGADNFLKLQDAVVLNLARTQAALWRAVLVELPLDQDGSGLCGRTVASVWWAAAMLVELGGGEREQRAALLERVVQKLPSLTTAVVAGTASTDGVGTSSLASLALYRVSRHLFVCLLQRHLQYPLATLIAALLHVGGAMPVSRVLADAKFRDIVRQCFVMVGQSLPEEDGLAVLRTYGPPWLVEIVTSAGRSISDCLAEQERRFQQFECQEREVEAARQNDAARATAEAPLRHAQAGQFAREAEDRAAHRAALREAAQRRRNPLHCDSADDDDDDDDDEEHPSHVWGPSPPSRQGLMTAHAGVPGVPPLQRHRSDAPGGHAPTVLQQHLKLAQERQRLLAHHEESLTKLTEAVEHVACGTDPIQRPPSFHDFIGEGHHALAPVLPVIPEVFCSDAHLTDDASMMALRQATAYAECFAPHVGVELRSDICARTDELASQCTGTCARPTSSAVVEDDPLGLKRRFPLDEVVSRKSISAVHVRRLPILPLHPTRCTFDVLVQSLFTDVFNDSSRASHPTARQRRLSAAFSEGDVVLLLLPLGSLLTKWVQRMHKDGEERGVDPLLDQIPPLWKKLGCYPRMCLVDSIIPSTRTVRLWTYPPPPLPSHVRPASPVPIHFEQALHVGFDGAETTLFLRRLTSINPAIMALRALHSVRTKQFASLLYDPRPAATNSRNFVKAIVNHMKPPLVNQVRARMVLQQSLNQEQATAVAMVLYSCLPLWDKSTPIHEDVADSGALIYDRGAETTFRGVKVPDILVIEGPPGTGKTHTLSVAVLNLLHHLPRGSRVLVCAPSNCAVDECLTRLCTDPHRIHVSHTVRRVGVNQNIGPRVIALDPPVFVDDVVITSLQMSDEWVSASNKLKNKLFEKKKKEDLSCANVVFITLGSLRQLRKLKMKFDVVVVDEASQATEPEVVRALSRLNEGGKCILIGDSKQLQPTVLCNEAAHKGLNRSLLVRLLHCGHRRLQLRQQYRMHPDICAFSSNYFYDNTLLTAESVLLRSGLGDMTYGTQRMSDISKVLGNTPRLVFMDVPKSKMQNARGRSLQNWTEATVVVRLMRQLAGLLRLSPTDVAAKVGIITFYRGQKDAIESQLTKDERKQGVEVATVDSFQGREKDIIIISCVRTSSNESPGSLPSSPTEPRTSLGFLSDWHRINVALTRAKELCVVVGQARNYIRHVESSTPLAQHEGALAQSVLTTLDSSNQSVLNELRAADEDPLVLSTLIAHCRSEPVLSTLRSRAATIVDADESAESMGQSVPSVHENDAPSNVKSSALFVEVLSPSDDLVRLMCRKR